MFVQHTEPTGAEPFSRFFCAVSVIMGYKANVEPPRSLYCNHLMGIDLLPLPAFLETTFGTSALLLYNEPTRVTKHTNFS